MLATSIEHIELKDVDHIYNKIFRGSLRIMQVSIHLLIWILYVTIPYIRISLTTTYFHIIFPFK